MTFSGFYPFFTFLNHFGLTSCITSTCNSNSNTIPLITVDLLTPNAPINVNPHYPPPGQYQGTVGGFEAPGVGDLTNLDSEILGDY